MPLSGPVAPSSAHLAGRAGRSRMRRTRHLHSPLFSHHRRFGHLITGRLHRAEFVESGDGHLYVWGLAAGGLTPATVPSHSWSGP
jgi:hypothetical protein